MEWKVNNVIGHIGDLNADELAQYTSSSKCGYVCGGGGYLNPHKLMLKRLLNHFWKGLTALHLIGLRVAWLSTTMKMNAVKEF